MLKQQLEEAKREKSVVELEFSNYCKHTQVSSSCDAIVQHSGLVLTHAISGKVLIFSQKLMCEAAVDKTEQWLDSLSSN